MAAIGGRGTQALTTHGRSKTLVYGLWSKMIQRCENPKATGYHRYGGRGIKVCDRWRDSFENFIEDMGERPDDHEIDRIDNDGNYEPGNCHWVTSKVNAQNRRTSRPLTYRGRTQNIKQWAAEKGISHNTINNRLKRGWNLEAALTTPVNPGNAWIRGTR